MNSIVTDIAAVPLPALAGRSGVFALGNFDGVHRGHQAVIDATLRQARHLGVPARVLTLEPHPRQLFNSAIAPFRLTPQASKERALRHLGIDDVVVMPFTEAFARLSPTQFVEDILLGLCRAQHVIAGFDFVFGHDRGGTMDKLRDWLAPHGVGVTEIAPCCDGGGTVLSSSRIRAALQAGDVETATDILGRPWSITGVVQHGAQLGTSIGVPTANFELGEHLHPRYGVYAVQAGPVGGTKSFQGVANIGLRPTVGGAVERLEVHLFDFADDIYDQEWEIALIGFQRPEQKFADLAALRRQITHDIAAAKTRLVQNAALP